MGGDLSPEPQTNFLRKQPSKFKKETGFILKANIQIPRAQKKWKNHFTDCKVKIFICVKADHLIPDCYSVRGQKNSH
jgi:hypothetical protein